MLNHGGQNVPILYSAQVRCLREESAVPHQDWRGMRLCQLDWSNHDRGGEDAVYYWHVIGP